MEGQNMEEEVTNESIIKDLQSKKIQMKEIKVGGEYQYRFVGNSAEYNLSGKRLHTVVNLHKIWSLFLQVERL